MIALKYKVSALVAAAVAVLGSASPADAQITFSVLGEWPTEARRQAAVDSTQEAVDLYNAFGGFNKTLTVRYNEGVGTADGSYNGNIRWGGTYPNTPIALHEISHTLGIGTIGAWDRNRDTDRNNWLGQNGLNLVAQFDGDGSNLNAGDIHFFPYGLNFVREDSPLTRARHVAMVHAIRVDMGIGNSAYPSTATEVRLTQRDFNGQSSFNSNEKWSDGYFAHAGADYYTDGYDIRTPNDNNNYTFAGDSLTLDGDGSVGNGIDFSYRGEGGGSNITIDSLVLAGGTLRNWSGDDSAVRLQGNLTVEGSGTLQAFRGALNVRSNLDGDGTLRIAAPQDTTDASADNWVRFQGQQNDFTGDLEISGGRFFLANGSNLNFVIGDNGDTNILSGINNPLDILLHGVFNFDLDDASANPGDVWDVVTATDVDYGNPFRVDGFVETSDRFWSDGTYGFSEATGQLSVLATAVPEPGTLAVLGLGGLALLRRRR